jgi:hypothetical protein
MAINFLNAVDLNQNQLNNAAIQSLGSDPGSPVEGQIYFNTAGVISELRIYANGAWKEVGATSGVEKITIGDANVNSTGVNTGLVRTPATGIGEVVLTPAIYGGAANVGMVPTGGTANKYLDGAGNWVDVTTGDVTEVKASEVVSLLGINVVDQAGPIPIVGLDIVGQTNLTTVASGDELIIYDLSTTKNKSITVEKLVGGYETTYTLPVSVGVVSPSAPTTGIITLTGTDGAGGSTTDVVTFAGTSGRVDVAGNAGGSTITVDLTPSITVVDNINLGGVITQAGGISTTGVNASALTDATTLILTADNTAVLVGMQLSGAGITGNITVTSVTDAKTFVLSGAITIANAITITFEEVNNFSSPLSMNNNRIHEVKTGVLGTDGVNLGQVQDLVAGIGLFKGGYNATTGLTVNLGAGNGSLDGASNIALDTGDFFVVTTDGSAFYTTALEVGDMIYANTTIAADSTPPESSYTVVIQDANVAGADSTDAATEKGVSGFDSASFTVSSTGWVQLKPQANPYGARVILDDGANATPVSSPSSRVYDSGAGLTTFTVNLTDATVFGLGALAANVKAEVTQIAAPYETVYADIARSGSGTISFAFTGSVAIDVYAVLLVYV